MIFKVFLIIIHLIYFKISRYVYEYIKDKFALKNPFVIFF